jgi:uncharacterized protein
VGAGPGRGTGPGRAVTRYTVRRAGGGDAERIAFTRAARPYLAKREADNNLALGILDGVERGDYPDPLLMLAEDDHGDTAAFVMRTPPYPLVVARGDVSAAREALLEALAAANASLPGMVGPLPEVEAAVAWWAARTGVAARRTMHHGVYRLRAVTAAPRAAGRRRVADERDRHLVVAWLDAFARAALPTAPAADPVRLWEAAQRDPVRHLHVWESPSGRVVSLAGVSSRTPNGVRIGPVFTPPEERGRGFAEALVADLSSAELARGARFCFLFTDLANATSNGLYGRVGYSLIGESAEYAFEGS